VTPFGLTLAPVFAQNNQQSAINNQQLPISHQQSTISFNFAAETEFL